MKHRFVAHVRPRDAEVPGYFDIHLDTKQLTAHLRCEPCLGQLCRTLDMTQAEVISQHAPGAYLDPISKRVEMNAGYDSRFDAGRLENLIWHLIEAEVADRISRD